MFGFDYNSQLPLHCSDSDSDLLLPLHIRVPVVIFWIGSKPLNPAVRYSYMLADVPAGNKSLALAGVEKFVTESVVVAVVHIDFGSVDR